MIPRNKNLIATLVCEPGCCAQIIINKNAMVSRSLYANGKELIAGQGGDIGGKFKCLCGDDRQQSVHEIG